MVGLGVLNCSGSLVSVSNHIMTSQDDKKTCKDLVSEFESLFCKSFDNSNAYNIFVCFTFSHLGAIGHNVFFLAAVFTLIWEPNVIVAWIINETSLFWNIVLCNLQCFFLKSSMFAQRLIKKSSMKHQCFRDYHIKNMNDPYCLHRNHQCFINVASMSHRCLFNEQACFFMTTLMNHQCYHFVLDWGIHSTILLTEMAIWKDNPEMKDENCELNVERVSTKKCPLHFQSSNQNALVCIYQPINTFTGLIFQIFSLLLSNNNKMLSKTHKS